MLDPNLQKFIDAEQLIDTSLSLSMMNKNEEALKVIEKAIECDPNFAEAYNKKGDFLLKLGRIKEALPCYLKSQELNPNIQNNYFDLGRTYLLLGDYENSLVNFKKANDMKPQDEIHAFIGRIYFEQGMYEEAKTCFEVVLNKNTGEAKSAVIAVIEATNSNTMAMYYYAQTLCLLGKEELAAPFFERIMEKYSRIANVKKNSAEAHYYLGKCHYFKGDYEKAIENIKQAIEYDTDAIYNHYSFEMFYSDAEAFASLAEAQTRAGHSSEARENILKAVSLEPNNQKLLALKAKLGY